MKLEAFHEQDNKKKFIIIFTILCVFLVCGVFLYKAFALYQVVTNKNIIEGTVQDPGDLYFAFYKDNVISSTMPTKTDGYVFDSAKSSCTNSATITWDSTNWGPTINNLTTSRTKCNLYFKSAYKDGTGASVPELYQGLIPVTYDASGNTVVANAYSEWYNYASHNWANAVLVNCADSTIKSKYFNDDMTIKSSVVGTTMTESEILQYYVWIPRYKYLLWNTDNESIAPQAISITFEDKTTAKSTGSTNGTWLTHPAFTFGTTELNGIWVGKFETTGTTSNLTIKPNSTSLRTVSISSFFTYMRNEDLTLSSNYGLKSSTIDTHMMKNTEWGVVAYLSDSIYGRYSNSSTCITSGCEVWINNNSNYLTGCAGNTVSADSATTCNVWNGTTGINASTTGNQYGIYDMSGGAWEYVMGDIYANDGTTPLVGYVSSQTSGFAGKIYDDGNFTTITGVAFPESKYIDMYNYGTSDADLGRGKLGDATKETLTTFGDYFGGWYADYETFPINNHPWFIRGGDYTFTTKSGLHSVGSGHGLAYSGSTARLILTAQ